MPRLILRLLGPPLVERDGEPVHIARHKALALLAYLGMTAQPHSRDALAALLWPELDQSSARAEVRRTLSLLRRTLGDGWLAVDRETATWEPQGEAWLDVVAFRQALDQCGAHGHAAEEVCAACVPLLAEAADLYRDGFLAGFTLPDSPAFDEWQFFEGESLREGAASALGRLARWHGEQGEHEAAIGCARRWVALDPLHEPAQRELMALYARAGQRAAALRQYAECERVLREELGAEPDRETRQLYGAIREDASGFLHADQSIFRPDRSAGNLPAQVTSFIGRERELAELGRLLADPQVRLVTVVGAGGMGKTRLALEAARAALDRYPGGTWLAELAPVPDGASVPRAVAAALGVQEQPSQPLAETIAGALQGRELLLLLDNCEHVLDGAAPLAALLLARCPELALLATSREPLRVAGEHLYDLPPMSMPETSDEAGLLAADAVQLFCQRAAAVRPGFALDGESAPLAAEICRRLDGMPLAIELAAARLRALSLPELARHLDDRFRLLTGGSRAALPRQQTLRGTIAWSYDLLSAGERLLFDRLSVFAGSFSLQGAEEVCSGEGIAKEEVLDLLAGLVDQSLVGRAEGLEGTGRYRLLETLRAYGQERLAGREETEEMAARHAWYYVWLAELLEPMLWSWEKKALAAWLRLGGEADDLRAAMRWLLARGQPELALRIGGSLGWWNGEHTNYVQLAEDLRRALVQGKGTAPLYQVKALDTITQLAQWLGHVEEALATAQEELALAQAVGDPKWVAAAMLSMAAATHLTGAREARRVYLREAAKLARQHDERVLFLFASVALALYEPPRQRKTLLEELLPLAPYYFRPWVHIHLALAAQALGDLDEAQAWAERSLTVYMELGEVLSWLGFALLTTAGIVMLRGDHARAEGLFGRVRDLSRRHGHVPWVIKATQALGHLAWRQGEPEKAASRFQEALDLAHQHGYNREAALARLGLALVAVEQEEHGQAEALCAQAGPDLPEWDDTAQALALCAGGRVALCRGQGTRAVELYRQALERVQWGESRPESVEVLEFLAWALAADGQALEAARLLALTEREREEMGMVLPPVDRPHHERAMESARVALGEEGFAAAWAEGQARDLWATAQELLAELTEAGSP